MNSIGPIIAKYRKERAFEYIDLLTSNDKFARHDRSASGHGRTIKLYTLGVSAGTGNFLDDEDFEELETDEFIPAGADFAVHITGDSMMPLFRDRDESIVTVTIDRILSTTQGDNKIGPTFECAATVWGAEKRFNLHYSLYSGKWNMKRIGQ